MYVKKDQLWLQNLSITDIVFGRWRVGLNEKLMLIGNLKEIETDLERPSVNCAKHAHFQSYDLETRADRVKRKFPSKFVEYRGKFHPA